MADLVQEIKAIDINVTEISIAPAVLSHIDSSRQDTLYLAYLGFKKSPRTEEVSKIEQWLKVRIKADKVKIVRNY